MKKKIYQQPRQTVAKVDQTQIICASTKSMYEEELNGNFVEQ
ncbi:MAG: hypothetical protein Q4A08_08675 [Bacteroidales bacterium]|nr:hypothetical protein [Bacteroidales bacterium]